MEDIETVIVNINTKTKQAEIMNSESPYVSLASWVLVKKALELLPKELKKEYRSIINDIFEEN